MFSVFVKQKATITENITFAISLSRIWSADWSKLVKNWKNDNEVTILWHDINVNFFWRFSVSFLKFSYWSKFHIKTSYFCSIFGDWDELWIKNLARMSLTECYWTLQNFRITAFTLFELLRENQLRSKITPSPNHPVVHHLVRYLVYTMFKSNNLPSFHSWFKGI